tara:strand:- start:1221 stop:1862 length:642 start_codon:yes stop_codon:yes gene_type:complete
MSLKKRLLTSLILLSIVYLIINFSFFLLFALLVFGVLSLIEYFSIIQKIFKNRFLKMFHNLIFTIFIFIFCFLFFFLSSIGQLKLIIFILLFGCIASDIGGFIFGKIFKGPKLTKISPQKTISGAFGSIFFSVIIINMFFYYLTDTFKINLIIISVITSIGCQLGDLFFSYLKRKAKIKDTGNILPGHGGVLDRLDGIFLGLPVGFIFFILLF